GTALLLISSSRPLMSIIVQYRLGLKGAFGIHEQHGGDLVSMSYLDNIKKFHQKDEYVFVKPAEDTSLKNIDLYMYGDSYVREIPDSAFSPINSYHFGRRTYEELYYSLDPHKKNILILEYSERLFRNELGRLDIYNHLRKKEPDHTLLNQP